MINQKNTGSYYTPLYLARFITKRVLSHFENRTRMSILEPSVGDGAFVEALSSSDQANIKLTALDINKNELSKAGKKWIKKSASFIHSDFLEYSSNKQFTAVIGNPPYVKKSILSPKQINLSKQIHLAEKLSDASAQNIWATFLVKANTLLVKKGVLAYVLPSELLQVTYAQEIREYLNQEFERIEFFTFNDLMFECKGQDTIVLFAYKKHKLKGQFIVNIKDKKDLKKTKFEFNNVKVLTDLKIKPVHGDQLTSDEFVFVYNLKRELSNINYYSDSKPGIVTAANKFFIINKETEKKYNLSRHTRPIIQKGLFVNGSVVFRDTDIEKLEKNSYPTRLLQLNDSDRISRGLREYLELGETKQIPNGYKCLKRNNWYVIPNIADKPDAFFLKRTHHYPKLLRNDSNALITDSAYKVRMRNDYSLNSFIYSFYNSLTSIFTELDGRFYGGGVLELMPSEFKKLPIPYLEITNIEFDNFTADFAQKDNIEQILARNDSHILNTTLGMSNEEISKLANIYSKLKNKRFRIQL